MNAVRTALLSLVLLAAALPAAAVAGDDGDHDHERAREAFRSGRALPLEAILARAQADFPGDVLDVEFEEDDGRIVYEIKTITAEGRVLKLKYDAATGELLRVRGRNGKAEGGHHGKR